MTRSVPTMPARHYLFFVRDELPKPDAHLIQVVQCANAAANLGYAACLAYVDRGQSAWNPRRWVAPRPRPGDAEFANFYSTQSRLRLLPLAMPWPIDRIDHKLTNASTVACKYYWPLHLRSHTHLVHTRDWNFVKAALQSGVPVVYECHHALKRPYEPDIVNHPLLQVAVTVIETVKQNMIDNGMPADKIQVVPNGFNQRFLERHPAAAQQWRARLLPPESSHLVVYAGALQPFKGVDLLLEVAAALPQVQFALAGGPPEQQQAYQQKCHALGLKNVALLGFLPQQDLAALLQAADVLAHPHLLGNAAEFTSPLKLFDYMASGTPIIASRIPSLKSLEQTPAVAVWCDANDPAAFTDALKQVLAERPWRATGYPDSINYVRQFSWENRIQRILSHVSPDLRPQRFPTESGGPSHG